jgi:hypothetical protein
MSDLEWIISHSLSGLTMEGELARLRTVHEDRPRKALREFQELRAETWAAIQALQSARQGFSPEHFTADDILGAAAVELRECAAEFRRKAQAEEAFRLRHGLPRAAEEV